MLDILAKARAAAALIAEGRAALAEITDAINDGRAAVDAKTQAELDLLLNTELAETKAARDSLDAAIAARL